MCISNINFIISFHFEINITTKFKIYKKKYNNKNNNKSKNKFILSKFLTLR